uniref:Uncharacterized protein n=1 Tax=Arundo donax TaxID=35708 RepID=A0A0A8Y4T9_ARUDO
MFCYFSTFPHRENTSKASINMEKPKN